MATETELKLKLDPAELPALRAHPLLLQGRACGRRTLLNTYYDSPDLALARARVALRLRRQGERIIQTLKTQGQSHQGLHQRSEWEWELSEATLDTARLRGEIWPDSLPPAAQLKLVPVFTTDFERECWLLDYAGAEIEVALDQGWIRCDGDAASGPREAAILELELELKSGPATALLALAAQLGETLALEPFDISKAQRGYQLFQQGRPADH